ncbi:MAG: hypothetical protein KC933_26665 [Myxococcales bacterium]|nr:hypothetical protein [Myxococcales bacterium]
MLALLAVVAASAGLLLLPRSDDGLLGLPELTLGEVSPRTVKSPTTLVVEDHETTEKARAQAAAKVPPTYDALLWMGDTIKQRIEAAFTAGREAEETGADEAHRAEAFMLELGVAVEPTQVLPLIRGANGDELRDAMIMVAQTIYESPVVQDRPYLALQISPRGVAVRTVDRDGSVQREATLQTVQDVRGIDQARAAVDTLVAERLERLEPVQRRALAGVLAAVRVYVALPAEHPEEHRLMSLAVADPRVLVPEPEAREVLLAAQPILARLALRLAAAAKSGALTPPPEGEPPGARPLVLWAGLQGVLQTSKLGRLAPELVDTERLAHTLVQGLLRGWGARDEDLAAAAARVDAVYTEER